MKNSDSRPLLPRRHLAWLVLLVVGSWLAGSPRLAGQSLTPAYDLVSVSSTATIVDLDVAKVTADDYPDLVTFEQPPSGPFNLVLRANDTTGKSYPVARTHLVSSFGDASSRVRLFAGGADGRRNDVALFDATSFGHALDVDNATASFSFTLHPSSLEMPTAIAAARQGTTPVVAVAYEGNPFDQNGGLAVRVGAGTPTVLTSTPIRRKFTEVAVADLDGDTVVDVAAQGPGYVTLWKGIPSGPLSFSPAGELTSSVMLTDGLTVTLVDDDGDPDLVFFENDLFAPVPTVTLVAATNTGTGSLGPSRFTRSSLALDGYGYGRRALFADRYDTDDSFGLSRTGSVYVLDAGRNQLRSTERFDRPTLTFLAGDPLDHSVVASVDDRRAAVADMDCNGTDDAVVARDSAIDVSLACHFPTSDVLGVQSGSSSIAVQGSPALGGSFTFDVEADQGGRLVGFMLGTDTTDTLISPGNHLHIDPAGLLCVKLAFTQSSNHATMTVGVPLKDELLGKKLATQAFVVKSGGAHAGFADLTKVVHQTVGKLQ